MEKMFNLNQNFYIINLYTSSFCIIWTKKEFNSSRNIIESFQNKLNSTIGIFHTRLSLLIFFKSLLLIGILFNSDNKFVGILSKLFFHI